MARILVIDDDPELLEMIELLLDKRTEHEAILSVDGEDGLSKARQDPPDLVIVDVMMPGMNGYDVCRGLREHPETASIPILVLTARGQPIDREAALQAGADEHLAKPIAMTDLVEQIEAMLSRPASSLTIVLVSLKGGVGVTTLAVNLAATLAEARDGDVCVLDLSPSSGHAALQFGLRPESDWTPLIQEDVIEAEAVAPLLLQPTAGLYLLASPVVPLVERELSRPTVEALLETLQERFDVVIVDAPAALNEATMAALDASTDAWLVVAADPASIQTAFGTVRALGERSNRFMVVLNQATPTRLAAAEAIERVLRRPVSSVVPFDPDQAKALAQGRPLALSRPDSRLARAIEQLAQDLI
jgi:MinD-like ATPase involved in chromosome partitioning or flagellar assembly/ActR/RegA family two-component response regulator